MDDQRFAWSESAPFRVVADAVPQMMWSARADGWIDWYNARWYDYTAQTPDEASGWGWQAVHHPEDLPKVMLAWPRSIATGEPFEMEFRLRGADGQFRWFLTRATPLRGDDGRVARWFGTNTDIDGARGARVREGFFSTLGAELAGALSLDQTLRVITRRIVPDFADWALVNLIDERGEIRLASAYHRDPAARAVLDRLRDAPSAQPNAHGGTAALLRGPDRAVRALFAPDLPRGIRGHAEGGATTIDIAPGSVLLCYTDGLTEFDRDPVRGEAIVAEALANTDERIAHAIYARVSNGLPPHDDVAILAVSFELPLTAIAGPRCASRWRFAVTDAEAAQRARREYVARLRAAGLGDPDVFSAELVFGEVAPD